MSVSQKVKKLLEKKRYTAKDLAKGIGMSEQGMSSLLKRDDLKISVLKKIALFLKTPIAYFIEDNSNYQVSNGNNNNIVNDKPVYYGNECEKLKKENRELKKEIKYLKEIVELLKFGK